MTPERWQQIKAVLAEANEQPPAERGSWLRTTCGDDDTLRHEVESLLALENQLDGFIEEAPVTRSSEQLAFQLDEDQEGGSSGRTDWVLSWDGAAWERSTAPSAKRTSSSK